MEFLTSLFSWAKSTQMCSPMSQTLLFSIILSSLLIAVGGFYVWRRYIRTQPAPEAAVFQDEGDESNQPMISVGDGSKVLPA